MDSRWLNLCVVAAAGALWCAIAVGEAAGQTVREQGYQPLDQLQDDVDPLSRSLRRGDTGLSVTGERQNVYRSADPTDPRLYYIAKGVIAEFDRSDYAFTRKGGILQLAPPNLVYHIGSPKKQLTGGGAPSVQSDQMIDGRVSGRVNGGEARGDREMIGFRVAQLDQSFDRPTDRQRTTWEDYHYLSTVNRMLVLGALMHDEAPSPDATR
jgi:hypothetical protein